MHYRNALLAIVLLGAWTAVVAAPRPTPAAPEVSARAHILMDFHSGAVLAEDNADEPMQPASLTKMMSAYVVGHELRQGNITLKDMVSVSEKAWRTEGSRMFIEVGTQVSVEDLLKGVIVQSGNDATVALAEHVAGTEGAFATLMNHYAEQLGMTNSHFVNSTGLPHEDHYTTARDMAILARALIRDFPEHYKWYSMRKFTYNEITQYNRNRLLWRSSDVDGVKTGHTESAGYCLVASANRDTMRLVSAVLGTESERAREQESQKLLGYGFRFYETHQLYEAGTPLAEPRIWKGKADKVPLGIAKPLYVTIARGQYKKLKPTISYEATIEAPVSEKQVLGNVNVTLDDEKIVERPLVALQEVKEGSWWKRLLDTIKLFFIGLFS